MFRYILASASPRRHELLKRVLPEFIITPVDADESFDLSLPPDEVCIMLACRKATACAEKIKAEADDIIIAADTIVFKDGRYYGKPENADAAAVILQQLRGSTHEVYTGVAVCRGKITLSGFEKTAVNFGAFSDEMINNYIADKKPLDKAGAYGIQDIAGYCEVTHSGDYENIMGLPLKLTKALIEEAIWCDKKNY